MLGGFAIQGPVWGRADGPGLPVTTLVEQRKSSSFKKKIQSVSGMGLDLGRGRTPLEEMAFIKTNTTLAPH